jgi:hypothetical protein
MRVLIVALSVALAVGVLAATAAADAPVVVQRNADVMRLFPNLTECQPFGYTFTDTGQFEVKRSDVLYYDNNGTLLREVIDANFVGTVTNDSTGKSLPVDGQRHITLDYVAGTFTETGVLRHVTVPGEGIVLHESGRIVTSLDDDSLIFMAGPHQFFSGDEAAFCAALADA